MAITTLADTRIQSTKELAFKLLEDDSTQPPKRSVAISVRGEQLVLQERAQVASAAGILAAYLDQIE